MTTTVIGKHSTRLLALLYLRNEQELLRAKQQKEVEALEDKHRDERTKLHVPSEEFQRTFELAMAELKREQNG